MRLKLQTSTVLLALLVFTGCSNTKNLTTETAAVGAAPATETTAQPTAETAEKESIFWARQKSARTRFVQADVDFMTGMIGHHAQALIMSDLAPKNGASAEIQTLAARIINAQKDEIALMQTWLRDRDQPVPEVHIDGLNLMLHGMDSDGGHGGHGGHGGMHDHSEMPGMLSPAQLEELAAAKGTDFDKLFLKYMIQHHAGAITMVDVLFATDGAGNDEASFKLAADINVDQTTEIARMQLMLDTLNAMDTAMEADQ